MWNKQVWIIRKQKYGKSGCKNPEKTKEKRSENAKSNPNFGMKLKKHTQDTKNQIRKSMEGHYVSDNTKEKMKKIKIEWYKNNLHVKGMTNKKQSENQKKIVSKIHKGKILSKETIKKIKEARAKQILPKKDTKIEIKIQNFLKQLGMAFFTHQYMNIKHGYQCDILIPSMNMVIECDGNYWHKYPIGNKIDHTRTKELLKKGFKVLRLWECEIKPMELNDFKERIKC